ncbi:hypothetical protein [Streptomyces arenae]|uniref:hypothetical protein n=1 Tax=Streptomyces arenae TaxID=29301 RepID=UPI00265AA8DC|nr:hypothetical protein [Streptomyces arenae]MCG7208586.1 hypothetical protein [Streptomyces arenae]
MFTARRMATVSGLVGSLAALCVGAGQAHADGSPDDCRTTAQGGTVCVHKSESRLDKNGTHVLKQAQDCSTSDRPQVMFPGDQPEGAGSTTVGEVVDCSNKAELPKGFKRPHIEF